MSTPIEQYGKIWIKRDDLFTVAGVQGGKVRSCFALSSVPGAKGLVTAGSRASPQVNIVASIAKHLGLPCRVHTPTGALSPEVQEAANKGAEVIQHKAGYNNVIIARAREDAARLGWVEIPFGMECQEAITQTSGEVTAIPEGVKRIIMPVGSGMSAAGVLHGLKRIGCTIPVIGIQVGADPEKRLDKFAPADWREQLTLIKSPLDYHDTPPKTTLAGIQLDPHYEAKCIEFIQPGDLFWIVGIRQTATHPMSTTAPEAPPAATPAANTTPAPAIEKRQPTAAKIRCAFTKMVDPRTLRPNPRNPNTHPPEQIRLLLKIIDSTGWRAPIVVSNRSGLVTKGHGRLETALLGNYIEVPVDYQDYDSDAQEWEDVLADNLIADMAVMNRQGMTTILAELAAAGSDPELAGILKKHEDLAQKQKKAAGALKEKFIVPPFTILDARSGDWLQRRQLWLQLGIASEEGREGNLTYANSSQPPHVYEAKNNYEAKIGRSCTWDEFFDQHPDHRGAQPGTSIFNPVLCEIMYNWFLPSTGAGKILDPFAGGSVRGIVAAVLGHEYTGIELRPEQVAANIANADAIFSVIGEPKHRPRWITGDSTKLDSLIPADARFDLVFTCPPYGDLEVYSDNPEDLSNMPESKFRDLYAGVIRATSARLYPNRFSIWIIGDYRDKKTGNLRNFVNTTINAHPFPLYNHAVLLTAVSSLAIRIGKSFPKQRKMGKAHQDAVILYNGNRLALEAAAEAEFQNVVMFLNGQASKLPDALGPIGAREVIPLGDILQQLTAPK